MLLHRHTHILQTYMAEGIRRRMMISKWSPKFKLQCSLTSLTIECVSRLLEKDLMFQENALDAHKKFIKHCLEKCIDEVGDVDAPKTLWEARHKGSCTLDTEGPKECQSKDEKDCPEYEEKMEDSPVLGMLKLQKVAKLETKKAEGSGRKIVPNETLIEKAIRKRSPCIKANAEKVTMACLRRLLEEDLKLDKFTLDPYKKFISQQLDEVLMSSEVPTPANNAKKIFKKKPDTKATKKSSFEGNSDTSDTVSDEEVSQDGEVQPRNSVPKSKTQASVGHKKRKGDRAVLPIKKRAKLAKAILEDNSVTEDDGKNSEDDQSHSSPEKPTEMKDVSTPLNDKYVEHLKSVTKACGMGVPPSIYKNVKPMSENKREGHLIKEVSYPSEMDTIDDSSPKRKNTRKATTLAHFANRRQAGERYSLEFDEFTGQPTGVNAARFISYVGVLARSKPSILIKNWKRVDDTVKNLIWQELLSMFDIPDDKDLKKRWISAAGERWKAFKTWLTSTYIFGNGDKDGNTTPCPKYSFIYEETWKLFDKSREDPEFQLKRLKGKEAQSKNLCPHRLSRGGYKKLKKVMKEETLKTMQEEAGDPSLLIDPPSPPRYELWKRARQKSPGRYTSDVSASIANKIESLVEASQRGTFAPHGRQDVLTVAIGKPEHPGRVRTAPRGVGIIQYYGGRLRPSEVLQMQLQTMKRDIIEKVTQDFNECLEKMVEEKLSYFGVSRQTQQPNCSPRDAVFESANGSCSPNNEEDPPSQNVLRDLAVLAMELGGGSAKLDLEHEHHEHFYLGKVDLLHLCSGTDWLDLSHLALWCTHLHRLCITKGTSHLYGFLDPYKICSSNRQESIQTYIQNKLLNGQRKNCCLGPYLHSGHWKLLVICPASNTVVWMCSMHSHPHPSIKRIVNGAMEAYNLLTEDSRKKKPNWVVPKVPKQNNAYACGYYVMKNMLTIISADIVSSWEETFIDESPLKETVLDNIQETWAHFFMTMYEEHNLQPKKPSQARNAKQKQ